MVVTYDPRYNIAYIRLREKRGDGEVESIRISDELVVDMTPDGTLYGMELLNANEQLRGSKSSVLTLVNEATGQTNEIPLAL
jgi:uncharacterized protein YuzE